MRTAAGLPSARGSLRLRLRVRVRRWRLDRELAAGPAGEISPELALRGRQLADPRSARTIARSLRRVVAAADRPPSPHPGGGVPVARPAVRASREALLGLAERLEQPVAVSPCGVARALMLLTDGAGPLFNPASERSLAEAIWWVADGLAQCPPHAWGAPVVIELDPAHVGWTCVRCGAIATTATPAVRPA